MSFFALGITSIEAQDVTTYYREVTAFRGFNIVDFTAGHRTSHVIIEGDKNILDGINEHNIEGNADKGVLHFYIDSMEQLHFIAPADYESKKGDIPDICYAIKAPISSIEKLNLLPNLKSIAMQSLDYEAEATPNPHKDVICDSSGQPILGQVRYHSYCRINNDE